MRNHTKESQVKENKMGVMPENKLLIAIRRQML